MKIKILGLDYDIKFAENENIDGLYGEIIHKKNLIRLNKEYSLERQKESLLHEVGHAINVELILKLNEDTISRLSKGLYQIIVDNPHIFSYSLSEKNKKEKK